MTDRVQEWTPEQKRAHKEAIHRLADLLSLLRGADYTEGEDRMLAALGVAEAVAMQKDEEPPASSNSAANEGADYVIADAIRRRIPDFRMPELMAWDIIRALEQASLTIGRSIPNSAAEPWEVERAAAHANGDLSRRGYGLPQSEAVQFLTLALRHLDGHATRNRVRAERVAESVYNRSPIRDKDSDRLLGWHEIGPLLRETLIEQAQDYIEVTRYV